jgi:hypothetical protein
MGFSHDLSESAVTCSCPLAATTIADLGSSWGPDWAAEPTFRPVVRDPRARRISRWWCGAWRLTRTCPGCC